VKIKKHTYIPMAQVNGVNFFKLYKVYGDIHILEVGSICPDLSIDPQKYPNISLYLF